MTTPIDRNKNFILRLLGVFAIFPFKVRLGTITESTQGRYTVLRNSLSLCFGSSLEVASPLLNLQLRN